MFTRIVENIRNLLFNPVECFEELKNDSLTFAYRQYFLLLVIYSFLLALVTIFSTEMLFTSYQTQLGSIPVIGPLLFSRIELFKPFIMSWNLALVYLWFLTLLALIFVKGFFLHLFVILSGGEQGISRTLQTILYAATPFLLLGWIPYIGLIGLLWAVVLWIIGIKICQDLSWERAVATVLLPLVLLLIGALTSLSMINSLTVALTGIL